MVDILLTFVRLIVLVILYIILFTVSSRANNLPGLRQLFTPEQLNQAAIALPIVKLNHDVDACLSCIAFALAWLEIGRSIITHLLCALHIPELDRAVGLPGSLWPNAERV